MHDALAHPSAAASAVPWRTQGAVYGLGLFNTSIFHISSVIVPLYAATINPSPVMFGLVFSAGHILPLFLSIRTGALMDRRCSAPGHACLHCDRRNRAADLPGRAMDLGCRAAADVFGFSNPWAGSARRR